MFGSICVGCISLITASVEPGRELISVYLLSAPIYLASPACARFAPLLAVYFIQSLVPFISSVFPSIYASFISVGVPSSRRVYMFQCITPRSQKSLSKSDRSNESMSAHKTRGGRIKRGHVINAIPGFHQ